MNWLTSRLLTILEIILCALIIGWRHESHDEKLSLNEVLREFELAV